MRQSQDSGRFCTVNIRPPHTVRFLSARMSPMVGRVRIVGLGGSSQSSKSSRGQSAVVEKPTMHVKWQMLTFHSRFLWRHNSVYQCLQYFFAQWGTSTCYEYQLHINREASHSVRSPLSRWLLWADSATPGYSQWCCVQLQWDHRADKNRTVCGGLYG